MTRRLALFLTISVTAGAVAVISRRPADRAPTRPLPDIEVVDQSNWAEVELISLRILAKRHIAREAATGRRPLGEAAVLFGELNRLPPAVGFVDFPALAGRTEGERLCRQVIVFAPVPTPECDDETARVGRTRLEAELQQELARDGTIRLPDPAGLPSAEDLLEQTRARLTEADRRVLLPSRPTDPPPD